MSAEPEPARGRPIPWLSGLVVALCLVATFYARASSREALARSDAALSSAEAYFLDHPYLSPGPVLESRLTPDAVANQRAVWQQKRSRSGSLPTPPRVQQRQQEELQGLVDQALAQVEDSAVRRLAWNPSERAPAGLLTHILPHAGQLHVVGNALLLLLLGVYLETRMGRLLYGVSLVGCAAGSAWIFALANPARDFALIGLSGTLAGLWAMFALRHFRDRDEGFYAWGVLGGVAWLGLTAWLGAQWSLEGALPGVASLAPHSATAWALGGGAAVGVALTGGIGLLRLDERLRGGADLHGRRSEHPLYRRAVRARARRRYREAHQLLTRLLKSDPEAHDAVLLLSQIADDANRHEEARDALLRAVRIELKRGLTEAAIENWLVAAVDGVPRQADPELCIRMALLLQESGQPGAALAALRGALARTQRAQDAGLAARVARVARDLDPRTAEEAAWRALGSVELEYEERRSLEDLLAELIPAASESGLELAGDTRVQGDCEPAQPAESAPEAKPAGPAAPIDIDFDERGLSALDVVPLHFDDEAIHVCVVHSEARKRVPYQSIDAVAVAGVQGLGPKPVILIDLILNWVTNANEKLRVVRLRADRFDPRGLVPGVDSPAEALRRFLACVIERAGAAPLPDPAAAHGRPFATFPSLVEYQRTVLLVEDAGEAEKPDD